MEVTTTIPKGKVPVTMSLTGDEASRLARLLTDQLEDGAYYNDTFAGEMLDQLSALGVVAASKE